MTNLKIAGLMILAMAIGDQTLFAQAVKTAPSMSLTTQSDRSIVWSQWRGPQRDGQIKSSTPWPAKIANGEIVELWSKPLGPSYSGPIVTEKLVFSTETDKAKTEIVRAFDRKTGEQRWESSWNGAMSVPFFAKANGDWIRSTPTYDGENLYVAGMRDVLVCLNAKDGSQKWQVDFTKQFGTALPSFGFVCSPLVVGKDLYVQAGGGFCKLDKSNGKVIWRTLVDSGGMNGSAFSSPTIATLNGKKQLLVQTREKLTGVSPESGEILWAEAIPTFRGMNILTPVVYKNSVFTSAYGGNSFLFDIGNTESKVTANKAWTNRAAAYMSSPVVVGDHLYMHLRNQRFTCIDLKSGETKWTTKPYGKYWSLVVNQDKILALDEKGDLYLVRANPEKFELLDSFKISNEPTWAHLAVSGDMIYVRKLRSLVAYRWSAKEK